jgi:hypothetical protein
MKSEYNKIKIKTPKTLTQLGVELRLEENELFVNLNAYSNTC